jgi:hypothetical protein
VKSGWRFTTVVALLALTFSSPMVASAQEAGRLGWVELLTHDARAAAQFYGGLFGWTLDRHVEGKYRLREGGELVGGITQISEREPDLDESAWLLGMVVADVDAAVEAALAAGGNVVRDQGRTTQGAEWAVVSDAQGAELLVYSGGDTISREQSPGHWAWAELWTTDPEAAASFYGAVAGWTLEELDHPDGAYPAFMDGDDLRAGMVEISGDAVSPGWAPYVGVTSVAAIVKRAKELGGKVLLEPTADIYEGRVAIIQDPTGVGFLVYELEVAE